MVLSEGRARLEFAFDILKFRDRGVAAFREWVILTAAPLPRRRDAVDGRAATQPLRVLAAP